MFDEEKNTIKTRSLSNLWNRLKVKKIGVVSLPIYVIFATVIFMGMATENIPLDLMGGLSVVIALGWLLAAIGDAIPVFNRFGASTILSILIPAILVLYNLLPQNSIDAVHLFMKDINFQNFYIFALIGGSILGMNRNVLVKGFTRMILPMATGFFLTLLIPSAIGWALGLGFLDTMFYIVTPAMGGGIAGGVLPLGLGYAAITGADYGSLVAILTPASILANFLAIAGAAVINQIGEKHPELSGNGTLIREAEGLDLLEEEEVIQPVSYELMGTGLFLILTMYIGGNVLESFIGLPVAVIIIFAATLLKYFQILPKRVELGSVQFLKSLSTVINMPMMVAIGIVFLSLEDVLSILTWQYFVVIFSVVATLALNGYFMARFTKMYPVEATILSLNQASMGGTGNIAILTTSKREELMPFAQIATRIGGALTISMMITVMRFLF